MHNVVLIERVTIRSISLWLWMLCWREKEFRLRICQMKRNRSFWTLTIWSWTLTMSRIALTRYTEFGIKLFSVPQNIIWDNIYRKDLTQDMKKIFLNGIVLLMFIFFTTPSVSSSQQGRSATTSEQYFSENGDRRQSWAELRESNLDFHNELHHCSDDDHFQHPLLVLDRGRRSAQSLFKIYALPYFRSEHHFHLPTTEHGPSPCDGSHLRR